nr:hypothetical protein [Tanacetum cinerariifolium]
AVTEVRAAMEAADNEFTRWEVQEREVDENALSIPICMAIGIVCVSGRTMASNGVE